jgi:hypothetical protein
LFALLDDAYLGSQDLLELASGGFDVGVLGRFVFGGIGAFICKTPYYSLDIADGLTVSCSTVGDLDLLFFVGDAKNGAGVAHVQAAFGQEELDRVWQAKQAKEVCDSGSILPGAVGDFLMRKVEIVGKALEGLRGFDRVQILALDVFDKGELKELIVGEILNDYGHLRQSGYTGGAQPAFARDKLKPLAMTANDERLDNAVRHNRFGEFADASLIELGARL